VVSCHHPSAGTQGYSARLDCLDRTPPTPPWYPDFFFFYHKTSPSAALRPAHFSSGIRGTKDDSTRTTRMQASTPEPVAPTVQSAIHSWSNPPSQELFTQGTTHKPIQELTRRERQKRRRCFEGTQPAVRARARAHRKEREVQEKTAGDDTTPSLRRKPDRTKPVSLHLAQDSRHWQPAGMSI